MLLHGNHSTITQTDYTIDAADYGNIIRLQLVVAESFDKDFNDKTVDLNHFIYGNYHLNYDKNVANEFARSYYMFEILSQNKENFPETIQNEYRSYYKDFSEKYEYTPTQYLSLLFWELSVYYLPKNVLTYGNNWRNVANVYGGTAMKEVGEKVIKGLSQIPLCYQSWTSVAYNSMWDFSLFNSYPFISDGQGAYISISQQTLKNSFFENLYWKVRACYPQEDSDAMSFYGRLFERYIQDLTSNAVAENDLFSYISEFKYGKDKMDSSDAYIRKDNNLLIIESKGYSILQKTLSDNVDILKNNKKLFINPILQADECFDKIDKLSGSCFNNISTAYIISVTMDNVNAVPTYLESIYNDILASKKSSKVKYFFNFSIDEYEMLMFLVENGIDFFEVLKNYFESKCIAPFSTFLHRHSKTKIEMTKWLKQIYKDACSTMEKMYSL